MAHQALKRRIWLSVIEIAKPFAKRLPFSSFMSPKPEIPPSHSDCRLAIVLCVAGFDPCGGAGLLADARAVGAFGAYALGVQTALVPQNTRGVRAIAATPPDLLQLQLETLAADIAFDAIKIGLLPDVATIEVVAEFLRKYRDLPIVIDPVLAPTRGAAWSDDATRAALRAQIFPLATMITPNLPEAQILSEHAINDAGAMQTAARQLRLNSGAQIVLLKGGHLENTPTVDDIYADESGEQWLRAPRVEGASVRGTGCLLASAIAAQLARGETPLHAARTAKIWMTQQWRDARAIGQGGRVAIF